LSRLQYVFNQSGKKENEHAGQQGNFITIEKRQQELAGIKTDTVKFKKHFSASSIIGTVAIDEEQVKTISSRVKGRIDKLFIKTQAYILKMETRFTAFTANNYKPMKRNILSLSEKSKNKWNIC
jgi:hypothetical protein